MRFVSYAVALLWALVGALSVTAAPQPGSTGPTTYVQVWLGVQRPDDDSWEVTDPANGGNAAGDIGTLPFGGGAGQLLWGTGAWQFGYEGGAGAMWKSETTAFRGTGNGARVLIDGQFFSFGVFMGGVLSADLGRNARFYVAAGPSATWAWLQDNGDGNTVQPVAADVIVLDHSESDVSFEAYGRVGFEVVLTEGFTFGASVRYADDEFDFGRGGKLKFDQPLWLVTLGARL